MRIVKISVLLLSQDIARNYKDRKNGDFWADLSAEMKKSLAPENVTENKKGNIQYLFCVSTEEPKEHYRDLAKKLLDGMVPDEAERGKVILSVTESEEAAKEKQSGGNNDAMRSKAVEKTAEEQPSAKTEEAPSEEAITLSAQAKKISAFKEGLLSRVRGQRHAVDEVVQSIFECEMFAAHNPKRKGPLATFLFTGPSGVGKTFLAEQSGELLGRKMLLVDMSEYSDNLANNKFNGDHGQPAVVTGFVRENPRGIIVFDEVEKAHINTIHLFLQILDGGRLMDHQIREEVSFRDCIIIMTTNAGKSLYDDATVCDLSSTPRSVILEALRSDKNAQTGEPYFPECITTRMANGHVILFNHLEPFALMEIVRDEIALQMKLFEESSGIKVEYDPKQLAALMLYHGGGMADARTLRGLTRNIIVRELQEIVMQLYAKGAGAVDGLKKVAICVDTTGEDTVENLFASKEQMYAMAFTDRADAFAESKAANTVFECVSDTDLFKRRTRGVVDYVLIDPLAGMAEADRLPNDIEDIKSHGMEMFDYIREYAPEIPVYILDTAADSAHSFDTLLARGARGIVRLDRADAEAFRGALEELSFSALINNAVYSLGRSGKFLSFNCAQYIEDEGQAVISFEKMQLKSAPTAGDNGMIARKGTGNVLFKDIVGCRAAKEALAEYCSALDNPRQVALSGKRMPKGLLLYGPPGTGKTTLAKAMANECGATFFPVSATSFFGSLVGETERNIREIFRKARKYAPAIIFVDEVDAIGRRRVGSPSTAHNEDALNAFLAEMDGFVTDEKRPVFILAATNYELEGDSGRVLDPAFVRRFDSKIFISLPDTDDRYEFLVGYLKKHSVHFGEHHEKTLRLMAERTGGMSNADLEMMCTQFIRFVGDGEPDAAAFMDALDAFRFGEVNDMDPDHLRQTACHEAGHALVCKLCGTTPSFLTVVSRGSYGGFMESAGSNKTGTYTYDQLMDIVCRCLAGRAAEIEVYGKTLGMNTGASSDIRKARYYIRACLHDYAMGEHMFTRRNAEEAETLVQAQYARTQKMLREHRGTLERLTDLLTEKKSLDKNQLEAFFAAENI